MPLVTQIASLATRAAAGTKTVNDALTAHTTNVTNPHSVTMAQIGILVLGASEPVPDGTPSGTVIIREST